MIYWDIRLFLFWKLLSINFCLEPLRVSEHFLPPIKFHLISQFFKSEYQNFLIPFKVGTFQKKMTSMNLIFINFQNFTQNLGKSFQVFPFNFPLQIPFNFRHPQLPPTLSSIFFLTLFLFVFFLDEKKNLWIICDCEFLY